MPKIFIVTITETKDITLYIAAENERDVRKAIEDHDSLDLLADVEGTVKIDIHNARESAGLQDCDYGVPADDGVLTEIYDYMDTLVDEAGPPKDLETLPLFPDDTPGLKK